MAIRYTHREPGNARKGLPDMDRFDFCIDSAADKALLPTPTVRGTVTEAGDATFQTYAAVDSTVKSDDLSIIGEIQSDGEWHYLGEEASD